MMNRTAETLFWIGRYLERAENHTRLIDVNYHMRHVLMDHEDNYKWENLITSIGDMQLFSEHFDDANETSALQFLTFDPTNENSLFSCITHARNNIRTLRQLLPSELWDHTNGFYLWFCEQDISKLMMQSPYKFYQQIKEWLSLFNGTADSTMIRDHVWNFIQAGRFFERAENSIRILHSFYLYFTRDSVPVSNQTYYNLIILLKSAGGYEAFRKLNADNVTFAKVIEFLISHPTFPRSVKYSLSSMEICLTGIKQQDYQFELLADKALDFVAEIKLTFSTLNHGNNYSSGLEMIHTMLESINTLGLEISKTFFHEEFVGL